MFLNILLANPIVVMYSAIIKIVFGYGLKSIRYMGAKTWNELPKILNNLTSKFSFHKNLKKFIQNSM